MHPYFVRIKFRFFLDYLGIVYKHVIFRGENVKKRDLGLSFPNLGLRTDSGSLVHFDVWSSRQNAHCSKTQEPYPRFGKRPSTADMKRGTMIKAIAFYEYMETNWIEASL